MARLLPVLLLALVPLLGGCSPVGLAELVLLGHHFEKAEGIAYGTSPRERLDVYTPDGLEDPAPVVVFIYGGRWQDGSRDLYDLLGDQLTRRGLVTVIPDYTLYPDTLFPGWVEQAASAAAWTWQNIADYGGNPEWIYLVGHSAGAHTVTLLEMDPGYLAAAGVPESAVRGVVSISGPVATEWTDADVQALMGPREGWAQTYPRNFIGELEGPILFLHGGGDDTVSPRNSIELADRIRGAGGCARTVVYPGIGHVEIMIAAMVPWLSRADPVDDIAHFISRPQSCEEPDRGISEMAPTRR